MNLDITYRSTLYTFNEYAKTSDGELWDKWGDKISLCSASRETTLDQIKLNKCHICT